MAYNESIGSSGAPPVSGHLRDLLLLVFSFDGRMGRQTYWLLWAGLTAVKCLSFLGLLWMYTIVKSEEVPPHLADLGYIGGLLLVLVMFFALIGRASIEARRNHDRGQSALLLALIFVPVLGPFFYLYLFVANGFLAGTPEPNAYG
ncbi:DUF805 domain-containing protein [Roseibium sediminis]|uniref:DUF805 domain-containing protein n=1 Tax=Roseibium sediminis TaxID=1775174 RepID=UPI00123E1082|nr:DUF805 domain-containing protein [Roseibium sediminis]